MHSRHVGDNMSHGRFPTGFSVLNDPNSFEVDRSLNDSTNRISLHRGRISEEHAPLLNSAFLVNDIGTSVIHRLRGT